jgi:uncharacterized protein YdgA (DUF945 family)
MKKLIVFVAVSLLFAAVWAGATHVVGGQVESRYASLLEEYGQWGPFSQASQNFHRGFLCSRAETVLEMPVPKTVIQGEQDPGVETVRLVFEHTLRNGPFPFGRGPDGRFSLAPAMVVIETRLVSITPGGDELEKLLANAPVLKDSFGLSTVGFNGSLTSRLLIPPFENVIDGNQVTWGGFTSEFKLGSGQKTLVGTFAMPKFAVAGAEGEIVWTGFGGQCDLVEALPMLYLGTSGVRFGEVAMNLSEEANGGRKSLEMKGFEVFQESGLNGLLVYFNQSLKVDGVTVEGKTYGPGVFEIEARNLDGEVLSDFQGKVQEVYRQAGSIDPEELVLQILPLYSQLVADLLEGNPEVGISRLHFVTPMGDVDGSFLMKFAGQAGLTLENPFSLLQALDARADLSLDESLAHAIMAGKMTDQLTEARDLGQAPSYGDEEIVVMAEQQATGQVEALLAGNFMVREGKRIKASATFNGGELVVNGVTRPLF